MLITLSEKRNEKLLIEWSGGIDDRHAQDFCDVCNAVLFEHFDLDYMHRKYEENIYGKSFFIVVYKDDRPIATCGARRNDIDGKIAFELCDFVTLPEARKGGYIIDMSCAINDAITEKYPEAYTYGYPGEMAYPLAKAGGSTVADFYARIYHGNTKDFQDSMPMIDDTYAEAFFVGRKNIRVKEVNGSFYLLKTRMAKRFIPFAEFLGRVSAETGKKFRKLTGLRLIVYYSHSIGILGRKRILHTAITHIAAPKEKVVLLPPLYKADTISLDFNGKNR